MVWGFRRFGLGWVGDSCKEPCLEKKLIHGLGFEGFIRGWRGLISNIKKITFPTVQIRVFNLATSVSSLPARTFLISISNDLKVYSHLSCLSLSTSPPLSQPHSLAHTNEFSFIIEITLGVGIRNSFICIYY